jgi:serine/threonine protein kinase
MGSGYLAETDAGRPVAAKLIKPEQSNDPDFRARIHSEVKRARQVPPSCTAEVLDAEADHTVPYLVVEYVERPSLAEIVQQRGPLTGGPLNSVAIGVATALAAIYDAGVAHGNLKPANVLFSLGTPKVIHVGIAATHQHTNPGKVLGTIAYTGTRLQSPTRPRHRAQHRHLRWGAIVTYAATGHTPCTADAPDPLRPRAAPRPRDRGPPPGRLPPA